MPKFREGQILDPDIMNESDLASTFSPKDHFASATAPSTPSAGWVWYNSTKQRIEVYNGSLVQWDEVGPKAVEAASSINMSGALTVGTDLTVSGNLAVNGTTFTSNTETVMIEDNLLLINNGEAGVGVTSGIAGFEIDRGPATTNYQFVFNETQDNFRVGTSGSTQAVATREDSPTVNGIGFWNNSSVRFDTSTNLVWDGTGLGIGTATPLGLINAQGGNNTGIILENTGSSGGDGAALSFYHNQVSRNAVGQIRSSLVSGADSTSRRAGMDFLVKINGTALGTMTSAMFIDSAANVGIGTTGPGYKLDVRALTGDDAKIAITKTDDTLGQAQVLLAHVNNLGGILDMFNDAGVNNVKIRSYGDSYFNGGNVGIGTVAPISPLHVHNSTLWSTVELSTGQDNIYLATDQVSGNDNVGGSIGFGRFGSPSRRGAAIAIVQTGSDLDLTGLAFFVHGSVDHNDPLVEAMRIEDDGKVGIGTTTIGANDKFHIAMTNASFIVGDAIEGLRYTSTATHGNPDVLFTDQDNSHTRAIMQLRGNAGANEVFFASSGGNVGIGTSTPDYLLDVTYSENIGSYNQLRTVGRLNFKDQTGGAWYIGMGAGLAFSLEGTTADIDTAIIYGVGEDDPLTNGALTFHTLLSGTLAERMRITSGGNVGIGTSTVSEKVVINDDLGNISVNTHAVLGDTNGNTFWTAGQSGIQNLNVGWIYNITAANAYGAINTYGYNNDLRIDASNIILQASSVGSVGIGTASPATSALLDLTSTTGALLVPRMTTTQIGVLTAVNGMVVYDSTTDQFKFYENGSWVTK